MTTLTITKTVDLTKMSEDTLGKQIDANRTNASALAKQINLALLGGDVLVGTTKDVDDDTPSYYYPVPASAAFADLSVDDVIAVNERDESRWGYGRVSYDDNITAMLASGYNRGWTLYVVTDKTAKSIKVKTVYLPDGHYDNTAHSYEGWPLPSDAHGESRMGAKGGRYIRRLGTVAEFQARVVEQAEPIAKLGRKIAAREVMLAESGRRTQVKEDAVEALRAPHKDTVSKVNKIAGFTLLYFSAYEYGCPEGKIGWSYEMRGQSYGKDPVRFVLALAAQSIGFRRLAGSISAEDYAYLLDVVKGLPEGKTFGKDAEALVDDDGTEDEV